MNENAMEALNDMLDAWASEYLSSLKIDVGISEYDDRLDNAAHKVISCLLEHKGTTDEEFAYCAPS